MGVLGAWMTFKKAEMAKTLKNGLSMIEMNPLNHNWLDFVILSGLTLHQFQKKLLLSVLLLYLLVTLLDAVLNGLQRLSCSVLRVQLNHYSTYISGAWPGIAPAMSP